MCSKSAPRGYRLGAREGSVLGRLIRRRWPAAVSNSAVRRVVFTVVDPAAKVSPVRRDGTAAKPKWTRSI